METRDYEDKNGVKRWVTEIVVRGGASNILPIDWPKSERAPPPQDHRQQPASARQGAQPIDDDIPF